MEEWGVDGLALTVPDPGSTMEAITELLRDPPTWVSVVEIVTGSLIGLYVLERISRDAKD